MDELERLRAENDELRTALREINARVVGVNVRMARIASMRERQEAETASLSQRIDGLVARLPQWVRVVDRLPLPPADEWECYGAPFVLVTTNAGEVRRGRPIYDVEANVAATPTRTFIGWQSDGEAWDIEVIAWMPLPEPYKP